MHQRGFPANQKSRRPHVTLSFTEAPLMRLSVGSLRQVVKRDLPIEFVPQQLTSYGGLELLHRYVRRLGLYPRLRRAGADLGGDYGGARLSLLLLALFYGGARRVEHLKYLVGDPLVHRFSGLGRMPTARPVTNWLRRFTHATPRPLIQLNQELVLESLARLDVPRLTLDVDGTVVFVKPWGARRRSRRWKKLSSAFAASETAVSTRQPQPSRLLWVSIAAGAARRPPWTLCQANAIVDPLPKVKLTPRVFGSVLFTRRRART